ncbi:unnamed protein product [Wuchereria bancrofti]|uniref:Uncharacterized protein n=1 Tax=Wuchereria bancrofti TaxID=6293 RepID=A0A3P7FSQ1_WUCBA|nr:unnamed protein product [Wuchereria bancrofti]
MKCKRNASVARQYFAYCLGPDIVSKVKLYQGFELCNFEKSSRLRIMVSPYFGMQSSIDKTSCHLKIFTGDLNSHPKNKDRNFRITYSNRRD